MSAQTDLRLDRLSLENFRCFAKCEFSLHPELTVLVAENGHGKTAILDAIRVALGLFVHTFSKPKHSIGFERTDVRLVRREPSGMTPVLPAAFVAEGYVTGNQIHWSRALKSYGPRSRATVKTAQDLLGAARQLRERVEDPSSTEEEGSGTLPLVAFYGTARLWEQHVPAKARALSTAISRGRLDAYVDCLSQGTSFGGLVSWFQKKASEIGDARFSGALANNLRLVAAVKEATSTVLAPTKWSDLDWDFDQKALTVENAEHGRLPVAALSDGIRNTIALVADVASRCAMLNPHFGDKAARQTPGMLMIDEVDLHLHPSWQQLVVELLRKAFPCLQMVLSTHSPQVLSTVDKESIRIVNLADGGQGLITKPTMQTRGVESADALATIMAVDAEPPIEEARWLREYRALIEDGGAESQEALSLRSKLISHFGESHPVTIESNRILRFQSFKLKRNRQEEQ
jgi:predicted ATP-binding protein involved in virulence